MYLSAGDKKSPGVPMIDPDDMFLIVLLVAVVLALLMPPGPGTPLRSPVAAR
jgi:hypothetical protein